MQSLAKTPDDSFAGLPEDRQAGLEHTPTNILVGTRLARPGDRKEFDRQIRYIKKSFGIFEQRLEKLLGS